MKYLGPPQSGSLANQTYSRNPFGQYVRARSGGGGPGVPALATIVAGWQALTDAQRQAWIDYAALDILSGSLGERRPVSGFQRFCGANLISGGLTYSDPPQQFVLPVSSTAGFVAGVLTGTTVHSGPTSMQWRSSGRITAGTMSAPGRGLWWKIFWGAGYLSSGSSSEDLSTPWSVTFGPPVSGDYFFVEWRASVRGRWWRIGRVRLQWP